MRKDEFEKLRASIEKEGCRDPLIVWPKNGKGILLDGHNRLKICNELGKGYSLKELEFEDKDHAILWALNNQLGRRNLTDYQFDLLIGQEYELRKKMDGRPRRDGAGNPLKENQPDNYYEIKKEETLSGKCGQNVHIIGEPKRTIEQIAEEHGINPKTVQRSADLYKSHKQIKEAAPEVATKLETGDIKATKKSVKTVGRALAKATNKKKQEIAEDIRKDFSKTAKDLDIIAVSQKIPILTDQQVAEIKEHMKDFKTKTPIPKESMNASGLAIIIGALDKIDCPICGNPAKGQLFLKCCNRSIDELYKISREIENKHYEDAEKKSSERRKREKELKGEKNGKKMDV